MQNSVNVYYQLSTNRVHAACVYEKAVKCMIIAVSDVPTSANERILTQA